MAINRDLWHEACEGSFRSWECPTCNAGTLGLSENGLHIVETKESKKDRDDDAWEAEWIDERFSAFLACQSCGEVVVVAGKRSPMEFADLNPYSGEHDLFYSDQYTIKCMYPAPPIFTLHEDFPETVSDELKAAFSTYWSNHAACANSIRRTIEAVMIEQGMKTKTDDGKPIFLHSQIEKYRQANPEVSQLLLGIKWFGNYGSHVADVPLSKNDLLKGFDILEDVLEKIYIKRDEYIWNLAKEMTQNRGKP